MSHVMLDLETMGRSKGCVVLSIGAVAFDIETGEIKSEFYRNLDCEGTCLTIDKETADWWEEQSKEAKDGLLKDRVKLSSAVSAFNDWFLESIGEQVWSQGSNFDLPIWEGASEAVGRKVPWAFWNARDTRTAYELAAFDPREVTREGTHHNALDDAKHQVKCLTRAFNKISKGE